MDDSPVVNNAATMREQDAAAVFSVTGRAAAAAIAAGGVLHGLGMAQTIASGLSMPIWYWAIFITALCGYETSAILILRGKSAGYLFAAAGPMIGGALIALGFMFPDSGLLCLIPGTYGNEITVIGFWTLVIEPIAVVFSLLFLGYGPKEDK